MTWLLILKLSTMADPIAIGMFYDKSMANSLETAWACKSSAQSRTSR